MSSSLTRPRFPALARPPFSTVPLATIVVGISPWSRRSRATVLGLGASVIPLIIFPCALRAL